MGTAEIDTQAKTMLAIKFYNFPEILLDSSDLIESMELDNDKPKLIQSCLLNSGDRVKLQLAEHLSAIFVVHHVEFVNVERCVG